jgi:hypothetical protein
MGHLPISQAANLSYYLLGVFERVDHHVQHIGLGSRQIAAGKRLFDMREPIDNALAALDSSRRTVLDKDVSRPRDVRAPVCS